MRSKNPYLLIINLLFIGGLFAQSPAELAGKWSGQLDLPGRVLKMNLTTSVSDAGELIILVDVPQQSINDMETTEVTFSDDGNLSFKLPGVPGNASWSGQLKVAKDENALDSLLGSWSQGGRDMPLDFARPSGPLAGQELANNLQKIESYATELLGRLNVPGAGITIVKGDEVLKSFGVGYADLESERPVTSQTVFAIGSSSKAFTSFGLGLLVDEGQLEWDTPVIEYMPDFRMYDDFATQEMTAVDLLCHRSGLPRHDFVWYFNQDLNRQDLYQRLQYLEPSASFRSTWQYQNLMYMTAGVLTEKISGQSWEDFISARILNPLGMSSTNFDINTLPSMPDYAYGYNVVEEELERMPYHPLEAIGPAGSINSNADDMAKWISVHLSSGKYANTQLIETATLQFLHRAKFPIPGGDRGAVTHPQYALGWILYDWNGIKVIEHGGNIDGFSALVVLAPNEELGMVILTNSNGNPYGDLLSKYALNILTGEEEEDFYNGDDEDADEEEDEEQAKEEERIFKDAKAQHATEAYAGVYNHPGYGDIVITADGSKLAMQYGDLSNEITHRHFETFRANIEEPEMALDFTFQTASDGIITSLEVALAPGLDHPIRFDKQVDQGMTDPAYLDKLAGNYNLSGQVLVIKRVRDHLTLDVPGQPTYELEAYTENEFKLTVASGYSAEFIFKGDKVEAMVLHQPNGDFRAERE